MFQLLKLIIIVLQLFQQYIKHTVTNLCLACHTLHHLEYPVVHLIVFECLRQQHGHPPDRLGDEK